MGRRIEKDRKLEVAGIFPPTLSDALSLPLSVHESRKEILISGLFQISIKLQTSLDRRFLQFGMTVQEASVLVRCIEAGSTTPGQLAVSLRRDKGMITRFIRRLELKGWITRGIDHNDRRISVIKPTMQGKAKARDLDSVFKDIRKELFVEILRSDVGQFNKTLIHLYRNAVRIGVREKILTTSRRRTQVGEHREPHFVRTADPLPMG
jgi:DNA-binding MarR family transcriptional regulator